MRDSCPDCGRDKDTRAKRCRSCASKARRGIEKTDETKLKMSIAAKARKSNWTGVKQSDDHIAKRLISRYGYDTRTVGKVYDHKKNRWHLKKWADDVKANWNNTCAKCGSTDNLHAHHIIPKHLDPDSELLVHNGIALCHDCHWDVHRNSKEV